MRLASRIDTRQSDLAACIKACFLNFRRLNAANPHTLGGYDYWRSCMQNPNSVCSYRKLVQVSGLLMMGVLTACSTAGDILSISDVKPWERGTLARDDMQLVNDSMQQSVDEHIYFSREASTGGVSVQGGGCGCN